MSWNGWGLAANLAQSAALIIGLLGYLPQLLKLLRSRSSAGLVQRTWRLWTLSAGCSLFYVTILVMETGEGFALLLTSSANFALIATIAVLGRLYS